MAKRKTTTKSKRRLSRRTLTPQQKKFREASSACHRETNSRTGYGRCMAAKLKSGKRKRRR